MQFSCINHIPPSSDPNLLWSLFSSNMYYSLEDWCTFATLLTPGLSTFNPAPNIMTYYGAKSTFVTLLTPGLSTFNPAPNAMAYYGKARSNKMHGLKSNFK